MDRRGICNTSVSPLSTAIAVEPQTPNTDLPPAPVHIVLDPLDPSEDKLSRIRAHEIQLNKRAATVRAKRTTTARSLARSLTTRSRSRSNVRADSTAGVTVAAATFWSDVWAGADDGLELLDANGVRHESAPQHKDVKLADLIRPSRSRGKKSKENGFEVIPRIRAVIALDDGQDMHELDPDDTWEYVSSVGDDEPKAILSYAEIVAKST